MVTVLFQRVRKQIRLQTVKEKLLSLNYAVIEFLPLCCPLTIFKVVYHMSSHLGWEFSLHL